VLLAHPWQGGFRTEAQLGVQAPVQFWEPLGFASDNNEETFNRRRRVELKHGRVSMLAGIGYFVPECYSFPGYLSPSEGLKFEDVPMAWQHFPRFLLLGGHNTVISVDSASSISCKNVWQRALFCILTWA